ncbi:YiiX/YebB-like N1pC/P60 family cysteine hydrolase [Bacillus mojavensis]
MVGDVLFFKKKNSIISNLISKLTKSDFTHVALIIAYDVNSNTATIIEANRLIRTRISRVAINKDNVIYSSGYKSDEKIGKILRFAYKKVGTNYDYLQIFGLLVSLIYKGKRSPLFNSTNKFICSELIDLAYFRAGIERKDLLNLGNITPQELIEEYDLKEVKKGA